MRPAVNGGASPPFSAAVTQLGEGVDQVSTRVSVDARHKIALPLRKKNLKEGEVCKKGRGTLPHDPSCIIAPCPLRMIGL